MTDNPILEFQGEYRWLSNFYPCSVYYDGMRYRSVENAYQAAKFLQTKHRMEIQDLTPGQSKRFVRTHSKHVREDWHDIKMSVMEDLLQIKFSMPMFNRLLVETGDREIIEGNTWGDTYWGVCNGKGENNLGKLIMKIRSKINESDSSCHDVHDQSDQEPS